MMGWREQRCGEGNSDGEEGTVMGRREQRCGEGNSDR